MNPDLSYFRIKSLSFRGMLFSYFLFGHFVLSIGQDSPITTASSTGTAVAGQMISVNISVTNFNNIGSVSLTMHYDHSQMEFVSGSINSQLLNSGNFSLGDNDLGNGIHSLNAGWYGSGNSLPAGSVLLTYLFIYHSGNCLLQWFDNGPSCAYTNDNGVFLNDIPLTSYYHNGLICGILPAPGTINGPGAVCWGTSATYSVNPLPSALKYKWNVPEGAVITGDPNSNIITVLYPFNTNSGSVSVHGENDCSSGNSSTLAVSVLSPPVADAGKDTTILKGSGVTLGGKSDGLNDEVFHWSPENLLVDPDIRNPKTLGLDSTTWFVIMVTNPLSQCTSTDSIKVSVKDLNTGIPHGGPDYKNDDFLIFPNPARSYFMLRLNHTYEGDLLILSISGSTVKNEKIRGNIGSDLYIDVTGVKPGLYFIQLRNKENVVIRRLVVL